MNGAGPLGMDELVKCDFRGNTFYITNEVLSEVMRRMQLKGRHLLSYKEAAPLYGIGESTLRRLAKTAGAIKEEQGMVYVNTLILDAYIEKQ